MKPEEIAELDHVDKIRNEIAAQKGMLPPRDNVQAMGWMAHYYSRNMERLGRYEAMQKQYFADLLLNDEDLTIGKAEALAKGSDFGQRRVFYERLTAGYQELINSFKKVQEFYGQEAKNQF